MTFTRWTEIDTEALDTLSPNLGIRSWDEVDLEQRQQILTHIKNKGWIASDKVTLEAILAFNEAYRVANLCRHTTAHGSPHYRQTRSSIREIEKCCFSPALMDFEHTFLNESQSSVYELLSFYIDTLSHNDTTYGYRNGKDKFTRIFNELSNQYGLNVLIGETSLIVKQDEKIVEEIYKPVLSYLNDSKWESVNRDLATANKAYLEGSPEGYSRCITLSISALQAYLQIIVNGKTGQGKIGELIKKAQGSSLISNDSFTAKILKDIQSILMEERQAKGDAHPKEEYANEKTARLTLNLTMIFIQHCS